MPADAVSEIKARLDIVEVVGGYVRLQRSGREHKALCPFHSEKTPSFAVSQERQAWYCFGCQEGGDLISFVQKIERLDFMQTLELLAERAGVELQASSSAADRRGAARRRARALELHARAQAFYEHVLWSTDAGAPGRALLEERGVPEDLARRFGLGFAPSGGAAADALLRYLVRRGPATAAEVADAGLAHPSDRGGAPRDRFRNRLVFPIRDERGAVIAFGGRALGDGIPKYLNSPGTAVYDKSLALFGIDLARPAIDAAGAAVLVEGYFDVLAAHAAGVRNAVATSGTALTREQVRTLARHTRQLVLCFDADDAGRAAASRAVDLVAAEGLDARICVLPGDVKDPDELVRRDPEAFAACVAQAPREWQVLLDRAIADSEGGSVEARRAGIERAVALLARIPEAATRELYVQQAARRLELHESAVGADVERARTERGRAVRLVATAPVPPAAPAGEGLAEALDGQPLSAWESYLGSLAVQRPALATILVSEHDLRPEELSPVLRRLLEVALRAGPGESFPLHALTPAEQRLAARLMMRPVPELADPDDPARLARAMADSVQRLREAAVRAALATVRRELRRARDGGHIAEAEELAARLHLLAAEAHRLRETSSIATG